MSMLLGEDAGRKRFGGVAVLDRHDGLRDDGAGVEKFVDEMHRAAAEFHAVFERLALRFQAGKRGQQRRVNIQDASAIGGDEIGREQAHEAGQADQVHARVVKRRDDHAVVGFALDALRRNDPRGNAALDGAWPGRARLRDC